MTTTCSELDLKKASPRPEPEHISAILKIAHIAGAQSASARAIAEYDAKRAEWKVADILRHGDSIFVVWE